MLTDQYCPNNLVSTIADIERALQQDVVTLISLIARCFGSVCALLLLNAHLVLKHANRMLFCLNQSQHGLSGCICQFAVRTLPMHHLVASLSL